jgi:hypothetical protein
MHASRSPHAGFPNCHTPPGPRHPLWHSSDRGERPTAGAFPPLVIESWRLQNRCGEMGNDERYIPGRRLVAGRRREVVSARVGAAATRPIHGCLSHSAHLGEPLAGRKPGRSPNRTSECMGYVINGGSRRWRPAVASVVIIGENGGRRPRLGRKPALSKADLLGECGSGHRSRHRRSRRGRKRPPRQASGCNADHGFTWNGRLGNE